MNDDFNKFQYTTDDNGVYRGYGYTEPSKKPKREKKRMPTIAIVAICAVISVCCGIVGGSIGSTITGGSGVSVIGDKTAVIFEGVTIKDSDGDEIKTPMTVGQIAAAAKDSIVEITTEAVQTGSFMMQYVSEGAGSGVIITTDGYIATNYHVIDGATKVSVRTTDGTSYEAKIIGGDEKTDLAVIKIEAKELTAAVMGNFDDCKVGDTVVAIGNPLGQLGGTVTDGIISALDREITIDNNIMTLIQTNTAINPGNSGGGLFNTSGQLIGVVNAKSSGSDVEGLGFAIPIDLAKTVITDLIEHGYVTGRIETGIEVIEITDFQTAMYYRVSEPGVYIYSVENGSKAEKAGLRSGDRIISIDGLELTSEEDYNGIIDKHKVGDILEFKVSRSGKEQTVSLELIEYTPTTGNNIF